MNIKNSLLDLFSGSANSFRFIFESTMNEIGLHSGQVFVLISLWEIDGQSQVNLARNLNLSTPTINKMVKSLTENGFTETQKCGYDGRIMRVYLTEKGRQSQSSVNEQWMKAEQKVFANFTDTEKLIFGQLCSKIKDSFPKRKGKAKTE